jgi:cell wall-associated NlpC family hydrolase
MFGHEVDFAIREHAKAEYPKESCGVIKNGVYIPLVNRAENPKEEFDFDPAVLTEEGIQAIVHSHPDGPDHPSRADMEQQMATGLLWGLVCTDGKETTPPWWWGPGVETPPLIGREFRHGPVGSDGKGDCYALVRDWYKINMGLELPEYPRDNQWWDTGEDMYRANFAASGFEPISLERIQIGDGILAHVLSNVPNHAGVYVGNGLILHHLPNRLSREEPLMRWKNLITHVLRPPSNAAS